MPHSAAWPRSWRRSTTPPRARPRAPAADAWAELTAASARVPEPLRTLWQQMAEADATLAFAALRELWGQQLAGDVAPACSTRRRRPLSVRAPGHAGGVARGVRAHLRQRRRHRRLLPAAPGRLGRHLDAAVGRARGAARQVGRCAAAVPARAGHPLGLLQRRRAPVRRAHGPATARARPRHRAVDDRRRRPGAALRARHARRADAAVAGPGRRAAAFSCRPARRAPARARASASKGRGRCCACSSACASSRARRRAAWCWCSTSKAAGRAWRRTTRRGRWPIALPELEQFQCPRRL